jgi:hypothetical protein
MKKVEKALPYVLLISYLTLIHFRQPQIADSIVIIALSALCGYRFYTDSKEAPDYLALFRDEMSKNKEDIENLKTSVGIYNIAQKNKEKADNVVW